MVGLILLGTGYVMYLVLEVVVATWFG